MTDPQTPHNAPPAQARPENPPAQTRPENTPAQAHPENIPTAAKQAGQEAEPGKGVLTLAGIGPGHHQHTTPAVLQAIAQADVVVGYTTYIRLVADLVQGKELVRTGMTEEIGRARAAVQRARDGARVVVISSGDAGVYGMASLVFQVLQESGWTPAHPPTLRVLPGITALNSCASLLGAPLGHDFCAISLSDLLTPWARIERRLEAAAQADFVIGLYNPASGRRTQQIVDAQRIIRKSRPGQTPVGLIKSAYRVQQQAILSDLDHFLEYEIGMNTTVIVGSTQSFVFAGYLITPRGYEEKYNWEGVVREGQRPGRSLVVEPPPAEGKQAWRA